MRHGRLFPISPIGWKPPWHLSPRASTPSARNVTRSTRGTSSARSSTSKRPTNGDSRNCTVSRRIQRSIAMDLVGESDIKEAYAALDSGSGAPHRGRGGLSRVDAGTRRPGDQLIWRASTSISRIRSRGSSAASPRPMTGRSITPIRRRISPGQARCGGQCRRASTPSPPGKKSPPSTTKACQAITCRSPRMPTVPSC